MSASTSTRAAAPPPTLRWVGGFDGVLRLLDQTLLPAEVREIECRRVEEVWEAIRSLRVRGAPAIGVAAGMGIALGARSLSPDRFNREFEKLCRAFAATRPTAVNLFWAIERMRRVVRDNAQRSVDALLPLLEREALAIYEEDLAANRRLGVYGAALLPKRCTVLTHCNAGGLATAGVGTALGVICAARDAGKRISVFADETRPLLQGARLTAWEYAQSNVSWLKKELSSDEMRPQWRHFWPVARAAYAPEFKTPDNPIPALRAITEVKQGSIFDLPKRQWTAGTMFFCAESITARFDEFEQGVAAYCQSVKPGGLLAAAFLVRSGGYVVADKAFPVLHVLPDQIQDTFSKHATAVHADLIGIVEREIRSGYSGFIFLTGRAKG